jgi:hypothetical protein
MVPIIYGKPTAELIEESQMDRLVLGGLSIKEFTHFCHQCQETYPEAEG